MQAVMRTFIKSYNERHGATLILTSHYMDDVAALCPRVIVVDKGRLSYDGGLSQLVQHVRPDKRVIFNLESPVTPDAVAPFGKVVSHEPARVVLQVPAAHVSACVARALASLPVRDLTVEDPPLEEVMSELFARSRAAAAGAA